jgi:hypothetical protein
MSELLILLNKTSLAILLSVPSEHFDKDEHPPLQGRPAPHRGFAGQIG